MSKRCNQPNCTRLGTSHCGACQIEMYCSVKCQQADWRDHKVTCGKKLLSESALKKFLFDALSTDKRLDLNDRNGRNIRYFKDALLVVEYQLGDRIPEECFRRLKSGAIFKDWPLFRLREILTESYTNQSTAASFDIALGYAVETRVQLEMRRNNAEDRNIFFNCIYNVNTQLGDIFMKTMRYKESLYHMQEALAAARHVEHDTNGQPSTLIQALQNMAHIHSTLKNGEGANYAEEVYILVSELHGPEHPRVQDSAMYLISIYLDTGNLVDAERFARINYECLVDPNNNTDRMGRLFAYGKMQIARVWLLTPPEQRIGGLEAAEEAETLSREAIDILENIERGGESDEPVTACLSKSYGMLAAVMMERGEINSEVEKIILKALSFTEECTVGAVPQVESTMNRYRFLRLLGDLYFVLALKIKESFDISLIEKSKCAYEESVIIATAVFDADDDRLIYAFGRVRDIDVALSMCRIDAQNAAVWLLGR